MLVEQTGPWQGVAALKQGVLALLGTRRWAFSSAMKAQWTKLKSPLTCCV